MQLHGTDQPITDELVAAGMPKEDIVSAEKPPEVQRFTDYGVG